jgi:hypothetical protein
VVVVVQDSLDPHKVPVDLVVVVHMIRRQEQETPHQYHHHKEILVERAMAPVDHQHMAAVVVVVPVQLELREHLVLVVLVVLDYLLPFLEHQSFMLVVVAVVHIREVLLELVVLVVGDREEHKILDK